MVKEAPYVALELGIAIAAGNIGIVYLIFQLEKSVQANHRTALMTQQMELQSESISALEQNYRKQRKATHEFLHHLEVLDGLLGQMRIDDAEAYIRQLQEQESARIFAINSHRVDSHADIAVFRGVLDRVGEEVREDFFDHVVVELGVETFILGVEAGFDPLLVGVELEQREDAVDEADQSLPVRRLNISECRWCQPAALQMRCPHRQ